MIHDKERNTRHCFFSQQKKKSINNQYTNVVYPTVDDDCQTTLIDLTVRMKEKLIIIIMIMIIEVFLLLPNENLLERKIELLFVRYRLEEKTGTIKMYVDV